MGTVPRYLTPRRPEDHKGIFGHALILAGSRGMTGAALLAAKSSLKSGVGLVSLGIPESFELAAVVSVPEALTLSLPETPSGSISRRAFKFVRQAHQMRNFDCLAIGPGLSQHPETGEFLSLVLEMDIPTVMDADALNLSKSIRRRDLGPKARKIIWRPSFLYSNEISSRSGVK